MSVFQEWWQARISRERIVIIILAATVILLIFQTVILNPLYQGRDNARNSADKQAELLQWMQQRSSLVKQLRLNKPGVLQVKGQSISQRINTSAKQAKVEINRFQTSGDASVQVWLDSVNFSSLLAWLEALQIKQAVYVENIAISETSKSGMVSARATFVTDVNQ